MGNNPCEIYMYLLSFICSKGQNIKKKTNIQNICEPNALETEQVWWVKQSRCPVSSRVQQSRDSACWDGLFWMYWGSIVCYESPLYILSKWCLSFSVGVYVCGREIEKYCWMLTVTYHWEKLCRWRIWLIVLRGYPLFIEAIDKQIHSNHLAQ